MSGCAAGRPMAPGTASWPTCKCTCDGEPVEWSVHVNHTSVRLTNTSPDRGRRGLRGCRFALGGAPDAVDACPGEALGRSRGGLTTELHLAADARGWPLVIRLTEGQAADDPRLVSAGGLPVLHSTPRPAADPPAAARGRSCLHHRSTRAALRHRAIGHTIPGRAVQGLARWAGIARRPPASLRPGRLPLAQRRRTLLSAGSSRTERWPPATPGAPPSTALWSSRRHPVSGSSDLQDLP
jgi:hypothetical protein